MLSLNQKKHFISLKDFILPLGKLLFLHTPLLLTTETQLKRQSSKSLSKCQKVLPLSKYICFLVENSGPRNPGTFPPRWLTLFHHCAVFTLYGFLLLFVYFCCCWKQKAHFIRLWTTAFPFNISVFFHSHCTSESTRCPGYKQASHSKPTHGSKKGLFQANSMRHSLLTFYPWTRLLLNLHSVH